jgi:MerR family transcriptional regulator/heat shock protein HspR
MHYLTIQQASRITGIPPRTLRFWEKEFEGILSPSRTKGGQRRYNGEDISVIQRIKMLQEAGICLAGIRERVRNQEKEWKMDSSRIDVLANRVAEVIRFELHNFFERERV